MTEIFGKIISMSFTASYCILIVCLARMALKKAPKIFSYALWLIVGFRLLCPVALGSPFSLIYRYDGNQTMEAMQITDTADNKSGTVSDITTDVIPAGTAPAVAANADGIVSTAQNGKVDADINPIYDTSNDAVSTDSAPDLTDIFGCIWVSGAFLGVFYAVFSYLRLRQRVKRNGVFDSIYKDVPIYRIEGLSTPFALGFAKPVIYMPVEIEADAVELCLAHEYVHIRRHDNLIKQFAFSLVCVYWFNPLVWIAFYLMTKDMEMSCDEAVIRNLSLEDKKAYSYSLLRFSSEKQISLAGSPITFGEKNAKYRIQNILNYKKPHFWVVMGCVLLLTVCMIGLLTNPVETKENEKQTEQNAEMQQKLLADLEATKQAEIDTLTAEQKKLAEMVKLVELKRKLTEQIQELPKYRGYRANLTLSESPGSLSLVTDPQVGLIVESDGGYLYDYANASIWAEVYMQGDSKDELISLGAISSGGTAYPLRADDTALWTASGHSVARLAPNYETKQLDILEYALEEFDTEGNVTYTYYEISKGYVPVTDGSELERLFDEYSKADIIDFSLEDTATEIALDEVALYATINTGTLKVRESTVVDAKTIALLEEGSRVQVIDFDTSKFARVIIEGDSDEDAKYGYVNTDYLDINVTDQTQALTYHLAKAWCKAFCLRDGTALYKMAKEKDAFMKWSLVEGSAPSHISFGTSNPWPTGDDKFELTFHSSSALEAAYRATSISPQGAEADVVTWHQSLLITLPQVETIKLSDILESTITFSEIEYD